MFDLDAGMPRINRGIGYLGTCLIAAFLPGPASTMAEQTLPVAAVRQYTAAERVEPTRRRMGRKLTCGTWLITVE